MTEKIELEKDESEAIREALQALLKSGYTQARIATETGVSRGAISAFLNRQYKGDYAKITASLKKWLDEQKRNAFKNLKRPDFIKTKTALEIMDLLLLAKTGGQMVQIIGEPGLGKTHASRRFVNENVNAWHVQVSAAHMNLSAFLRLVARMLNVEPHRQNDTTLMRIQDALYGRKGILIIDDAQHLGFKCIEILRHIYDTTQCAIALIGNPSLGRTICQGNTSGEFAQIVSRVMQSRSYSVLCKEDLLAILDAWQVKDGKARIYGMKILNMAGGLRTFTHVLDSALLVLKSLTDQTITSEVIADAYERVTSKKLINA